MKTLKNIVGILVAILLCLSPVSQAFSSEHSNSLITEDQCPGWTEFGANNLNTLSVPESCGPLIPDLELDWKTKHKPSVGDSLFGFSFKFSYAIDGKLLIQDGDLHCYDILSKGKNIWNTEDESFGLGGLCCNSDDIYIGTEAGIKCFSMKTGKSRWEEEIGESNFLRSMISPIPCKYEDNLYFSIMDTLYSLNQKTRKVKNIYSTSYDSIGFHPTVLGNNIYTTTDEEVICVDIKKGKMKWSYEDDDEGTFQSVIKTNNEIVIPKILGNFLDGIENLESRIICLSPDDGKLLWTQDTSNTIISSLVASDGKHIYYGQDDGNVICKKASNGKTVWQRNLSDAIAHISKCGEFMYVTTINMNNLRSELYILDSATGKKLWNYSFSNTIVTAPIISDGRIILISEHNEIYCFKGKPLGDPAEIILENNNYELEINDSITLSVIVEDENNNKIREPNLRWSSSDESIGSIDSDGLFTANSIGECTIYVECESIEEEIIIVVVEKIDPIFENEVDFGFIKLDSKESRQVTIINRSPQSITIKLDCPESWITLSQSKFKILGKGTALLDVDLIAQEMIFGQIMKANIDIDWGYGESKIAISVKVPGPSVSPNQIEAGEIELDEVVTEEISLNNTASTWIDMKVTSDSDWLTVDPVEFTLKKMGSEKINVSIDTSGLFLGNEYNGVVRFEWRKGGFIEVPVSFTTPADDVAPTVTILPVEDQIVATECEILIETDEVCVVMIGEVEAVLNEEETHYVATVPLSPAPSINEFEVIATDMAGNESKETIEVKNIDKLVVVMQIGSNVMTVRGEEKPIEPAPTVIGGSTMVPVRAVSEAFGAQVDWRAETKTVIITLGESVIILSVNSTDAYVNNEPTKVEPPPQLISGSTMLPFRFIAEALGATIDWNGETKTITMTLMINP